MSDTDLPPGTNQDGLHESTEAEGLTFAQAQTLADAISEAEDLAFAVSAFEQDDGTWAIEATCDREPDLERFAGIARSALNGDIDFSAEEIDPDIDWVSRSQENLAPIEAGGFLVHGSHDAHRVPKTMRAIRIDAAQAFGTGHHATTTGCLEAIDYVLRTWRPRHCLDVGTGTGVLAIALAKRLHRPILATDIDPMAVRTTRANARANQVAGLVRPIVADDLEHPLLERAGPFDLIVANILAQPLIELAPQMAMRAHSGTRLILSGILSAQAGRVAAAYRTAGFTKKRRLTDRGWATLILEKR